MIGKLRSKAAQQVRMACLEKQVEKKVVLNYLPEQEVKGMELEVLREEG